MQGLVFDISNFKFTKSGSIFVHFTPTNATLSINGKPYQKKQGFFGGGILVSNLVPKTYEVSVMKDGYTQWIKELKVAPGKVSVAARVTLWKNIEFKKQGTSTIDNFFATEKGFVFKTSSSSLIFEDTPIKGNLVELYDINSSYIVTKTHTNSLFLIDLNTPAITRDFRILFRTVMQAQDEIDNTTIQKIAFHPFSKTKLVVETLNGLYIFDLKRNTIESVDVENKPVAFGISTNEIFIINKTGDLVIKNLMLGSRYIFPIDASSTQTITPSGDGNFAFITQKDKTLYLFDRNKQTLKKVGTNIVFSSFSSDGLRTIFIDSNNTAHIYYLDDYEGDSIKTGGTIELFTIPNGARPDTFVWIPFAENYGMIRVGNTLRVIELDVREPHNATTIAKNITNVSLMNGYLFAVNTNGEFLKGVLEE